MNVARVCRQIKSIRFGFKKTPLYSQGNKESSSSVRSKLVSLIEQIIVSFVHSHSASAFLLISLQLQQSPNRRPGNLHTHLHVLRDLRNYVTGGDGGRLDDVVRGNRRTPWTVKMLIRFSHCDTNVPMAATSPLLGGR